MYRYLYGLENILLLPEIKTNNDRNMPLRAPSNLRGHQKKNDTCLKHCVLMDPNKYFFPIYKTKCHSQTKLYIKVSFHICEIWLMKVLLLHGKLVTYSAVIIENCPVNFIFIYTHSKSIG